MTFVHLHCHTEYSLLESPVRLPALIAKAKSFGMDTVAMTDNGTMYGAIAFYLAAKKSGLRPIIGCEMYVTPDIAVKERAHNRLILLCKSYKGYQNLIRLVSVSHLEGFYYKPRIDMAHLAQFSEDLIAISPGYRGLVAQCLRDHRTEAAREIALQLKQIYGDDFFLGLQRTGALYEDIIGAGTLALSKALGIPLVAANDVYALEPNTSELRRILGCIQTGRRLEEGGGAWDDVEENYFKSPEAMAQIFADVPEALANTIEIANRCQLSIATEQVLLPLFECPDGLSSEAYLEQLVWHGVQTKYGKVTDEIRSRVLFELDIINRMQYAPYFLIIFDFLDFCVRSDIPVGPGRGSAAGSIVAYALNITKIDPIRYKLLFERFLNPERVSMPDIDLDFCIRRRGEVIDYIVAKYGTDCVSQIITFGTMAARGVVRDVGRTLDVPLSEVDRIAKLIPSTPGHYTSIDEALDQVPELRSAYTGTPQIRRLLDIGQKLEGLPRHTSTHAAGVVISRDPLMTVVPLLKNDGQIVTQYPMGDLEKIGLLKMDILGLRNLTVMDDCVRLIKHHRNIDLNLEKLPMDDQNTYDLLCAGNTIGVFQLESRGMRTLIKDLKPTVFEDIIALLALYRPGPLGSGMVNDFISNKSGKTQVKYDLPDLEPILKETYGMIVYQEQVMQIATAIGGFSLGQSDMLRRAMGKKNKEEMDRMRDQFLEGAHAKSIDTGKATRIFELCYKFAEYGFNKSHSAAYALVSYQTAYLKANYGIEYMTALLSSVTGIADRTSLYIQGARAMGLDVFPPHVNTSDVNFSITKHPEFPEKEIIRFGLGSIRNVGEGAVASILASRTRGFFENLPDFVKRVDLKQVNKRVLESLIKAGAFDGMGDRGALMGIYERVLEVGQMYVRERSNGQVGLFDVAGEPDMDFGPVGTENVVEIGFMDRLKMEKEMLGLYLSGHPLDHFQEMLATLPFNSATLTPEHDGQTVTMAGIVLGARKMMTRSNREMLLGNLEDLRGSVSLMMFCSERDGPEKQAAFQDDCVVKVTGRLKVRDDEFTMIVDEIALLDFTYRARRLMIDADNLDDTVLTEIRRILLAHHGPMPVCFGLGDATVLAHRRYWVEDNELCRSRVAEIAGSGHVWVG